MQDLSEVAEYYFIIFIVAERLGIVLFGDDCNQGNVMSVLLMCLKDGLSG